MAPDAPVSLGVISNPFSRTNSRTRLNDRILPRFLPHPGNAIDTRTPGDLDRAIHTLLFERGVNVLGLNGGDGTLHLALNRLVVLREAVRREYGENMPLPTLLFLNGGTLNIVSRATGTRGNPIGTVRRFARRATGRRLADLPARSLPVLRVDQAGEAPRYGFVFGTELVANAMEMYTMFGEGYGGLARFLAEVVAGYALHTRLWQEHGWKLDPPTTPLAVDGVTWPRYLAAVATTIDLSILKGFIHAVRVPPDAGMAVRIVSETHAGRAIRMLPWLMFERDRDGVHDVKDPETIEARGGYTLDGEVFLDRSHAAQRRGLRVSRASFDIRAVAP